MVRNIIALVALLLPISLAQSDGTDLSRRLVRIDKIYPSGGVLLQVSVSVSQCAILCVLHESCNCIEVRASSCRLVSISLEMPTQPAPESVAVFLPEDPDGCPAGWLQSDGLCFHYSGRRVSAGGDEVRSRCSRLRQDAEPARLLSSAHRAALASFLAEAGPNAFVGVYMSSDGQWQLADGSPAEYMPWGEGLPDGPNGSQTCAAIQSDTGALGDLRCTRAIPYFCSIQL